MMWWHWLILALPILPNLWSIWHVRKHEFTTEQEKSLWLLLAIFVPVIGGMGYILLGRRRAHKGQYDEKTQERTAERGDSARSRKDGE